MSTPEVALILLDLEEKGLVTVDEEDDCAFEPTAEGKENDLWLTELQKLLPGIYIRSN